MMIIFFSKRSSGIPFEIFLAYRKTQPGIRTQFDFLPFDHLSLTVTDRLRHLVLTVYFFSLSKRSHWDSEMPSEILTRYSLASIPKTKIQRCAQRSKLAVRLKSVSPRAYTPFRKYPIQDPALYQSKWRNQYEMAHCQGDLQYTWLSCTAGRWNHQWILTIVVEVMVPLVLKTASFLNCKDCRSQICLRISFAIPIERAMSFWWKRLR